MPCTHFTLPHTPVAADAPPAYNPNISDFASYVNIPGMQVNPRGDGAMYIGKVGPTAVAAVVSVCCIFFPSFYVFLPCAQREISWTVPSAPRREPSLALQEPTTAFRTCWSDFLIVSSRCNVLPCVLCVFFFRTSLPCGRCTAFLDTPQAWLSRNRTSKFLTRLSTSTM